jgi:hypothetical protein
MKPGQKEERTSAVGLLGAAVLGMLGVVVTLALLSVLVGAQATPAAALSRMRTFLYWSQPFIYLGAGVIAGAGSRRWGAVHAPVVGVFLASVGWLLVRRRDLLPPDPTLVGYMFAAGGLFALVGGLTAPLLREKATLAVVALVAVGLGAFAYAYVNLGAVSGQVQREVTEPAEGTTVATGTVPVSGVRVALVDNATGTELYATVSDVLGRYSISKVPRGTYTLRAWDTLGPGAPVDSTVTVQRSLTGGTPWQTIALPAHLRESP